MKEFLVGIDAGTTGARCMIFDLAGTVKGSAYREYASVYPRPGWAEQNIEQLVSRTMEVCRLAIADAEINAADIGSIGFSIQRVVTGPVDRSGVPVRPFISWQDTRAQEEVADVGRRIDSNEYFRIVGIPLIPILMANKMLWMRRNEPDLYEKTYKFTQNQDYVLKEFGAEGYFVDLPDMSFYGLWDLRENRWSDRLMELFEVTPDLFGTPTPPGTQVGSIPRAVAEKTGFAVGTPICTKMGH